MPEPTYPEMTSRSATLRVSLVAAAILVVLAAYALQAQFGLFGGEAADSLFGDWIYNALLALAGALCVARAVADPKERGAWWLLGGGLLISAVADVYWTLALADLAEPPYPSVADGLWLVAYPLKFAGLMLLARARLREAFRPAFWLDAGLAASSVAAVAAALVFPAVLDTTGGSMAAVATNLAYPAFDFLLLALAAGMVALAGWRPGRSWILIAAGFTVTGVADCIFLVQAARGTYVEHTLVDPLWPLGALLVGAAALQAAPRHAVRLDGTRIVALPSAFALVALGLLALDHWHRLTALAVVLAVVCLLLAGARLALLFRENLTMLGHSRTEALTDALTGLGNRRRLLADIDRVLATGRPRVLALFDLDGFKRYNDTYGHPAGDALLGRLGAKLGASVAPYGSAYRMGGDEFCILFAPGGPGTDSILAGAKAALSEGGEGFAVTPSTGVAELPREARTSSAALQLADGRMYSQKDRTSRSASRQAADALLRVLREREPALYEHLNGVGELAVAVGRRLGLASEELDVVCRAAELHDVGKMAVPDAILGKAGPLDENEWAFMRRHTIIGERILGAAPALAPVARLVRSTHERWDGHGYPDRLAGEDIPLGARIVAVCDAYDAMVSDRPYRDPVPPAEALEELRRCSGTQFDPDVVDVFCAEMVVPAMPEDAGAAAELT